MIELIYTTVSSRDDAKKLAELLLEKNLAACIQIIDGVVSIYRWEGEVQESYEIGVLIKTTRSSEAIKFLKTNHPYSMPCILSGSVNSCQTFKVWVNSECQEKTD